MFKKIASKETASEQTATEQPELPSIPQLVKALAAAVVIAIVVLVLFILPAEYGIDITGVGDKLGLTQLNDYQVEEQQATDVLPATPAENAKSGFDNKTTDDKTLTEQKTESSGLIEYRKDEVVVTIPPQSGVEYKLFLEQYGRFSYQWQTQGNSELYFDLHGEPKGDTSGYFESYAIATAAKMQGSMTTPFAGSHGWYWKNSSDQAVEVHLITQGDYRVLGLKK